MPYERICSINNFFHDKNKTIYRVRWRITRDVQVGLNILEKITYRALTGSNEFPEQEVKIGFHQGEPGILVPGDRNHYWKIRKNKLPV